MAEQVTLRFGPKVHHDTWLCDCCEFRASFKTREAAEAHERKNSVRIDDGSWQVQEGNEYA